MRKTERYGRYCDEVRGSGDARWLTKTIGPGGLPGSFPFTGDGCHAEHKTSEIQSAAAIRLRFVCTPKKPRRVRRPQATKKAKSFSTAAIKGTPQGASLAGRGAVLTLVEFSACGKRSGVAGTATKRAQQTAILLSEKPEGVFRQSQHGGLYSALPPSRNRNRASPSHHMGKLVPHWLLNRLAQMPAAVSGRRL